MSEQNNDEKLNIVNNNYVERKEKLKYNKENIEETIIEKLVAIEDSIKNAYSNNDDKGLILKNKG